MVASPVRMVGIAWYRMDAYVAIVDVMADGPSFPKTHASWRQKAGRMERELKRQGVDPVRIEIDPEAFIHWCGVRHRVADSESRSMYVSEMVREMHDGPA